jgi:RNA polymerase-binding transcription factor DksA
MMVSILSYEFIDDATKKRLRINDRCCKEPVIFIKSEDFGYCLVCGKEFFSKKLEDEIRREVCL